VFFLRKFFRNSVSFNVREARLCSGARDAETSAEAISRHNCAAGKTSSCRKKNRAKRVAFGLPQDFAVQLMFEACVNRGSGLSAFRGVGFHVERHLARAARRPAMRRKRLNRRSNLLGCTGDCARYTLKRFHRHGFPHQRRAAKPPKGRRLPPVRRNTPSFGRKTPPVRALSRHAP
jgi:hypothetical protein